MTKETFFHICKYVQTEKRASTYYANMYTWLMNLFVCIKSWKTKIDYKDMGLFSQKCCQCRNVHNFYWYFRTNLENCSYYAFQLYYEVNKKYIISLKTSKEDFSISKTPDRLVSRILSKIFTWKITTYVDPIIAERLSSIFYNPLIIVISLVISISIGLVKLQ